MDVACPRDLQDSEYTVIDDTQPYRQIHPKWVHDGTITSQAVSPARKDDKHLSVCDGDMISHEDAWRHYAMDLRRPA